MVQCHGCWNDRTAYPFCEYAVFIFELRTSSQKVGSRCHLPIVMLSRSCRLRMNRPYLLTLCRQCNITREAPFRMQWDASAELSTISMMIHLPGLMSCKVILWRAEWKIYAFQASHSPLATTSLLTRSAWHDTFCPRESVAYNQAQHQRAIQFTCGFATSH